MDYFGSYIIADPQNKKNRGINEWRSPYIYLDPDATLELVNQYLNPYVEDRTMEDLDIPS